VEMVRASSSIQIKEIDVITSFMYLRPPPKKTGAYPLIKHQTYTLESKYILRNLNFIGWNPYPAHPSEGSYYTLLIHPCFITSENIN
jgi:hypothetical protein